MDKEVDQAEGAKPQGKFEPMVIELGQLRLEVAPSRLSVEGRREEGLTGAVTLFLIALGGLIIPFGTRHETSLATRIVFACAIWAFAIVFAIINSRKERMVLDACSNCLEYTPQHRRKPIGRSLLDLSEIKVESDGKVVIPHYRLRIEHPHGRIGMFFGHDKRELEKLREEIASFLSEVRSAV